MFPQHSLNLAITWQSRCHCVAMSLPFGCHVHCLNEPCDLSLCHFLTGIFLAGLVPACSCCGRKARPSRLYIQNSNKAMRTGARVTSCCLLFLGFAASRLGADGLFEFVLPWQLDVVVLICPKLRQWPTNLRIYLYSVHK